MSRAGEARRRDVRFGRRKPPMAGEWQSCVWTAKQQRFFWHAAAKKLCSDFAYIAHIFHVKN
ncbi:conserved hypothetical protein [Agrobacterium sp. NCPPB 925]|nr:conserved hypothetical protein [Agrobacterium sp. NCPPB 925]